jgi:hypothetical protein
MRWCGDRNKRPSRNDLTTASGDSEDFSRYAEHDPHMCPFGFDLPGHQSFRDCECLGVECCYLARALLDALLWPQATAEGSLRFKDSFDPGQLRGGRSRSRSSPSHSDEVTNVPPLGKGEDCSAWNLFCIQNGDAFVSLVAVNMERIDLTPLVEAEDGLHASTANSGHDVAQVELEAKVPRQTLHGDPNDVVAIVYGAPQPGRHAPRRERPYTEDTDALEAQALDLGEDEFWKG